MDRWLFVHVMKTAGTSFRELLQRNLGSRVYPTRPEVDAQPDRRYLLAPELLKRLPEFDDRMVICGHLPAAFVDELPGRWRTAIFLREPISRTASIVRHRQRKGLGGNPIDHLGDERFVANQVRDYQTKVLAMGGMQKVNRPYEIGDTEFDRAVDRLMRFDFIGLTEDFAASVGTFAAISSIHLGGEIPRMYAASEYVPSQEEVEAIRPLVAYDERLYEVARARARAQRESMALAL